MIDEPTISRGIDGCYKHSIAFFSLFVLLGGAAVLGGSIWTAVTIGAFPNILGSTNGIFICVYVMIAVGSAMFFGAFFGCVAAYMEKKHLLILYCIILLIIFLVEIVGSVLAFVYYPIARDEAQSSIVSYDESSNVQEGWDKIQGVLECCGINAYTDWKPRPAFPTLPASCCDDKISTCEISSSTLFQNGCDAQLRNFFHIIGGVGLGVLLIEIVTILASGCALRQLTDI